MTVLLDALTPLSTLGIGSVPYLEGENTCEKIFRRFDLPFWPQYPARSRKEQCIFQFLHSFPGLTVSEKSISFNEDRYDRHAGRHREKLRTAFLANSFFDFEPSSGWSLGYSQLRFLLKGGRFPEKRIIKLQVTAPETVWDAFFAGRVTDSRKKFVFDDLCNQLIASGLAQIQRVQFHRRTPLIFIDAPLLETKEAAGLKKMIQVFRRRKALVGIHVCGNHDWGILEGEKLDVFHFDLHSLPLPDATHLNFLENHLKRGGWVAWGIIPTVSNLGLKVQDFSPILLNWRDKILSRMASREAVVNRTLLAPACGTGALEPLQDEAVWKSLELIKNSLDSRKAEVILQR